MTNVLLTSAGRRSYLVRYFQEALGNSGKVIVANTYTDVAAAYAADLAFTVPHSWHPDYVPMILHLCREHSIRLLCSLHDLDIYFLAQHRAALQEAGVVPVLPDANWARICLDKMECSRHLHDLGFSVPWTDTSLERARAALARGLIQFPLLVKARHGFGSLGLARCRTEDELSWHFQQTQHHLEQLTIYESLPHKAQDCVLIQEEVSGNEYCLDIVNDLEGNYAAHFVGLVHGMRAGETESVTTIDPSLVGDLPYRLSKHTRHLGMWGIDILFDGDRMNLVDINPRFTGDYPFHHLAGANLPATLLAWLEGHPPAPAWLQPETGIRGYKDLVPRRVLESPHPQVSSSGV